MRDQPQQKPFQELRDNAQVALGIAQAIASMVLFWLHRPGTMGSRYVGIQTVIGFLFLWAYAPFFFPHDSPVAMIWFASITTGLMLLHRICFAFRLGNGYLQHSQYSGTPWFRFVRSEIRMKSFVEPMLVWAPGTLLLPCSIPLGTYLMLAGVCLAIDTAYQVSARDARLQALRDSRIEQKQVMDALDRD
jgi:hypothetical protein